MTTVDHNHHPTLLVALREQRETRMKGGIYHRTQIELTYNSNHIEGSRLTEEQTRMIFDTHTIGLTDTCLTAQDRYKQCLDYFGIAYTH